MPSTAKINSGASYSATANQLRSLWLEAAGHRETIPSGFLQELELALALPWLPEAAQPRSPALQSSPLRKQSALQPQLLVLPVQEQQVNYIRLTVNILWWKSFHDLSEGAAAAGAAAAGTAAGIAAGAGGVATGVATTSLTTTGVAAASGAAAGALGGPLGVLLFCFEENTQVMRRGENGQMESVTVDKLKVLFKSHYIWSQEIT